MTERFVFVGLTNRDPERFLQLLAGFKSPSPLPDEPPRSQLLFLADKRISAINKKGEESNPAILVIEDQAEQLLQAAQDMFNNPDGVEKQAIQNLSGALTIVKLETNPSDTVDPLTGIRVVHLDDRRGAYPVHPTPDI